MLDPHQHVLDYVDDYFHGCLEPADAELLIRHCRECPSCAAALDAAQERFQAVAALPVTEASEALVQATLRHIETNTAVRQQRWNTLVRSIASITVAASLLIGLLHLSTLRMRPNSFDLRILGQSDWLAGSLVALRVGVFDRASGEALEGVPVEITLRDAERNTEVTLASFKSRGLEMLAPRLQLPQWASGRYELRVVARTARRPEVVVRRVTLKRSWKLLLTTDKPLYQPGQTIHLRALGLRQPDLKPIAGHDAEFAVTDPGGNVIFRTRDTTSRFGIVAADCPLATELIEGDYQIQCRVGDTTSERTVRVERYVLPKFRVTLTPDRPFYVPSESVQLTVHSEYFFGEPVRDAVVELAVYTTDVAPRKVHGTQLRTDAAGQATHQFELPARFYGRQQLAGDAQFQVFATVTDNAGQTQTTSLKRIVTTQPLRIELIPESGTLVPGVANKLFIYTSYVDGRPASCRVTVSGVSEEVVTDAAGIAQVEVTPPSVRELPAADGPFELTATAREQGNSALRSRTSRSFTQPEPGDYLVRPDRAVCEAGETLRLKAWGAGVAPVFVDFLRDGQTILSDTIEMKDGFGELVLDLPPDVFGTLQLITYRFGSSGLPIRKSRVLLVKRADTLQITAAWDAEQYRPGDRAVVKFSVTDSSGAPRPGALSLAMVDEAVFSAMNQSGGVERVFFLLEQELLKPVYTIYNRDPSLPTAEPGQRVVEEAAFSRSATAVVGRRAVPTKFTGTRHRRGDRVANSAEAAGDGSVFTLVAESFFPKASRLKALQRERLQWIVVAWLGLGGALCVTAASVFAVYRPRAFLITGGISLFVIGGPLLLLSASWGWLGARAQLAMDTAEAASEAFNGMPEMEMPVDAAGAELDAGGKMPRVRTWFPETLLWRPELITDDQGQVELEVPLADSITSWRLSASAVGGNGELGSLEQPVKVFQPFFVDLNLPVALTRGDQVEVPAVVYNYSDQPQEITLEVKSGDWYRWYVPNVAVDQPQAESAPPAGGGPAEGADAPPRVFRVDVAPGSVAQVRLPIRATAVGTHQLEVVARGGELADALRRDVTVLPNGRKVESTYAGRLDASADWEIAVDSQEPVVPGSAGLWVKFYPSGFSQLVEGLDAIFKMPYGCFEQTSSTTYPNVLALAYLRENQLSLPALEAKARQYIHLGYQRLLSFEVSGGGFDWFGQGPASVSLTAYGLLEFEDMARVHDVDPKLLERTRAWLLSQRRPDGKWQETARRFQGVAADEDSLGLTAYVAWAVFRDGKSSDLAADTLAALLKHEPASLDDPYLLALVLNAVAVISPDHPALAEYAERLVELSQSSADGKQTWWENRSESSLFFGRGISGDVETTALASLALLNVDDQVSAARRALTWLVTHRDPQGTWYSTQATVLALKALLAAGNAPSREADARQLEVLWDGEVVRTLEIDPTQYDVVQQLDLSSRVSLDTAHRLQLKERSDSGTPFQVIFRYFVEGAPESSPEEPLEIQVAYDRERLAVDDEVEVTAVTSNRSEQQLPMVMLDLPVPPGFMPLREDFQRLVDQQRIARFEVTSRQVIVYLLGIDPTAKVELKYRLRATMPLKVAVPGGQAYQYYAPTQRAVSPPRQLEVTPAP